MNDLVTIRRTNFCEMATSVGKLCTFCKHGRTLIFTNTKRDANTVLHVDLSIPDVFTLVCIFRVFARSSVFIHVADGN